MRRAIEQATKIHDDALRAYGAYAGSTGFGQVLRLADDVMRRHDEMRRLLGPLDQVIESARRFEAERQALLRQVLGPTQTTARIFEQIRKQVIGPLQALRDLDEKEERLSSILASRGWVMSPSLPVAATHELLRIYDAGGIAQLEAALIVHYDGDQLERLLAGCYDRPSFDRRRDLFQPALDAHRRGEYVLSVPIWLSQIDGIVYDELEVARVFTQARGRRNRAKLERQLGGDNGYGGHMLTGLLTVLEAIGASGREATPEEVRRHLILHGLDLEYGAERNSIQGVLMLELLHMFFAARDRRDEAAA